MYTSKIMNVCIFLLCLLTVGCGNRSENAEADVESGVTVAPVESTTNPGTPNPIIIGNTSNTDSTMGGSTTVIENSTATTDPSMNATTPGVSPGTDTSSQNMEATTGGSQGEATSTP